MLQIAKKNAQFAAQRKTIQYSSLVSTCVCAKNVRKLSRKTPENVLFVGMVFNKKIYIIYNNTYLLTSKSLMKI